MVNAAEAAEVPPGFVTLRDYAELHGKPVETIRTAFKRGRFTAFVHVGGRIHIAAYEWPTQQRRRWW